MNRRTLLLTASALDALIGDPEYLPHPVRIIGKGIDQGERLLRTPNQTNTEQFLTGATLAAAVVLSTYAATATTIRLAYRLNPFLGAMVEVTLAATTLAARNLHDEAIAVLDATTIEQARTRLARIVGRDTARLGPTEISRAVIETVAESASDGIIAPMFYLALGGVPAAMAYKAINTLDSMIGHADARYLYFGKAAARLDDVANLIPARLTALAIAAASGNPRASLATWRTDARNHKSPNAGHPESAMSGALEVQLGGSNTYAGDLIETPIMGAYYPPANPAKVHQAITIVTTATLIALTIFCLIPRRNRR
ncbi:adenosylcobinamide-phosphate synthase CbiB [Granulicella sibirica]|uniref:Cobalamin biosynthesis protein CobD n=1 Tax=Granulicella sibirica TaxID=2479048 RepID=A0A4Q0T4E5_9BACT|nr:adenosylcobinamide-phosphate synthase CbiB [Granulicella sibirica]RXH56908.1 Adenosylcobinamide-phosphate synthase [Granulicella sibirica]